MAPKKIKTHKDSLKRPCFQCCVTKISCNRGYIFDWKVFATPLIAYYYYNTIAKLKQADKEALINRLLSDTGLKVKGDLDNEIAIEDLLTVNSVNDETGIEAVWNQECLMSAEDFEKLEIEGDEEDFEDEKPAKIKSYIYLLEEDTVTEMTQTVGQPLDQFLPPELWYVGEKTLVHKNRDISVTVYVEIKSDEAFGTYKNELFSKYFGEQTPLFGKVYIHSFSHLPMMESANAALDKEMEKMEVEQEVKQRKKKARVPRKKVQEAIDQLHASEPGSAEEKEAVQELQEVAQAKKKRAPKRKISAEALSRDLGVDLKTIDEGSVGEVKEPSPKKAKSPKKSEEEKAAEKKQKEEAKAQKQAEKEAAKKQKEEEKAKKAEEREQKKKEKESKKKQE
jgi:hypothetical protein